MTPVSIGAVTLSEPHPSTHFDARTWLRAELPLERRRSEGALPNGARSLMTEVHLSRPYAALGGTFTPGSDALIIRVGSTGDWEPDGRAPSGGLRHPGALLAGLPHELALGALAGMLNAGTSVDLVPGELTVDLAAYDPIESSIMSFKVAGGLLLWALMQDTSTLSRDALAATWDRWSGSQFSWM